MSLLGATNGQVEIAFGDSGDANIGRIAYNHDGNYLATVVNASEVMRIDSGGHILQGTTDTGYPVFGDNLTLEGSGHSGMTIRSGTSSQGTVYFSDDTGTSAGTYSGAISYKHSANSMHFRTNSTDRVAILSTGNVGIGISSPDKKLHISDTASNQPTIRIETSDGGNKRLDLYVDGSIGTIASDQSAQSLAFRTAGGERMRITSGGNVGINRTSVDTGSMLDISHTGSSKYALRCDSSETSGTQYHILFSRGGTTAGYITSNSATTIAFNNASDERLKENIENSGSAIQDIKDLKVRQFDWKDNIDTHKDFGFVAQELHSIIPEAVAVGSDELDDNGKPKQSWGVDYSHIVPRLVKAVQEQQTRIESLEAEVTALKNQP